MAKFHVIALTIGNRCLGEVEAESREEALELANSFDGAESNDVTEIVVEPVLELGEKK